MEKVSYAHHLLILFCCYLKEAMILLRWIFFFFIILIIHFYVSKCRQFYINYWYLFCCYLKEAMIPLHLYFFFFNPFLCFKMWTILHQLLIFVLLLFKRGNDTLTLVYFFLIHFYVSKCEQFYINYWYLFCCYLKEAMILLHFLVLFIFMFQNVDMKKDQLLIFVLLLFKRGNDTFTLSFYYSFLCFKMWTWKKWKWMKMSVREYIYIYIY